MMKKHLFVASTLVIAFTSFDALALDNIIRPQFTARSAGMGGVRYTTGLYEENFFANPARATDNPTWRVTLIDPSFEINSGLDSNISKLTASGDTLTKIGNTAGTDNHVRIQMTPLAFYIPAGKKPLPKELGFLNPASPPSQTKTDTIKTSAAADDKTAADKAADKANDAAAKASDAADKAKAKAKDAAEGAASAEAKAKDDAAASAKALTDGAAEQTESAKEAAQEAAPKPVAEAVAGTSERKWAFAVSLVNLSVQTDIDIRNDWSVDPQMVADIGPAVTWARRFLDDNSLSVGVTSHVTYRLATRPDMSLSDVLNNSKIILPTESGGERLALDFDLGTTYALPWQPVHGVTFSVAAAINNIMGGKAKLMDSVVLTHTAGVAPDLPRTFNFGFKAENQRFTILHDNSLALEVTDIGNNTNGGVFRLVHIGGETHLAFLALRAGINQGYLCAGAGLDLKVLTIDFGTYGEEMSLNPGGLEDRRYALKIGIQI